MADTIRALLRQAGIPTGPADQRPLNLGKTLIRLTDRAGYVKLGRHPAARALLRAEIAAYRAPPPDAPYRRPELLSHHDGEGVTLLWLSALSGGSMRAWSALRSRPGPYELQASGQRQLADLMPDPDSSWTAEWRRRVAERWGDLPIPLGPVHGDFVYWNLLRPTADQGPGLLDFEYYDPAGPAGIDRLFWRLAPFCRQAVRRGAAGLLRPLAGRLPSAPQLALALLRHGARLEREEMLPDVGELNDAANRRLRRGVVGVYSEILRGLIA